MAVDLSKGNEYIIFAYAGNTMIGRIYAPIKEDTNKNQIQNFPPEVVSKGTIINTFIDGEGSEKGTSHYMIENPCKIQFEIKKPKTGSATMNWTLTPLFYSVLLDSSSGTHKTIFAFPKQQVVISSVGGTFINDKLVSAWKELCE